MTPDGPGGGQVGLSDLHGTGFIAGNPGLLDGSGTLHHWAFRFRHIAGDPTILGNMSCDCFRDGVLQASLPTTLWAIAGAQPPGATPALRFGGQAGNNAGVLFPSFVGPMATIRLTHGSLSDAQIAADAALTLGGTVHPLRADTVGLWQLQNSLADAGTNALSVTVETGAAAYVALGNGLVGFNFNGSTDLITPHSNLLVCYP